MSNQSESGGDKKKKDYRCIFSAVLRDKIVELVYRDQKTALAVFDGHNVSFAEAIRVTVPEKIKLVPYWPSYPFIAKGIVLFPSDAEEYGDDKQLADDIGRFIHKYLDISPLFEKIATYYVMLTWVHDRFDEMLYLRALGEFGSGKSRFLKTIGSICYKPIFTTGATTIAPIFRIIDQVKGTLILDEADHSRTDATADFVKILNSGHEKGHPVLRMEGDKKLEIKTYDTFGPKILATRRRFYDLALESRFLIEEMDRRDLREDIPINLPREFPIEALHLRNKLLMWRFRNHATAGSKSGVIDATLEPRLNQITMPLMSVIADSALREEIKMFVKDYNEQLLIDRGMDADVEVLEVLIDIFKDNSAPTVKEITDEYNAGINDLDRQERITARKMGHILRSQLQLRTGPRSNRGIVVREDMNSTKIAALRKKYGIQEETLGDDEGETGGEVVMEGNPS